MIDDNRSCAVRLEVIRSSYLKRIIYHTIVLFTVVLIQPALARDSQRPLSRQDVIALLRGGVFSKRVTTLVEDRGISFMPTDHDFVSLRRAGADDLLLHALERASQLKRGTALSSSKQPAQPSSGSGAATQLAPESRVATLVHAPVLTRQTQPGPTFSASSSHPSARHPDAPIGAIAPGTRITIANWRRYRQYMPTGMVRLFEGRSFWKMSPDVVMSVGPTTLERLPAGYTEATRKYSAQVKVVHRPDSHNDIANYVGGEPFPEPQEPDKGYKLLADLWFAYVPHIVAGTPDNPLRTCTQDALGDIKCFKVLYVYRQLAYNTDPGVPREEQNSKDLWYSEWSAILEPEQAKYTAQLDSFTRIISGLRSYTPTFRSCEPR